MKIVRLATHGIVNKGFSGFRAISPAPSFSAS